LVVAGIAIRRIRTEQARNALKRAEGAADSARIPALAAEVDKAARAFRAPAARIVTRNLERVVHLEEVETLLASNALVVDACRGAVRSGATTIPLVTRPVLFALARALASAWPGDVPREALLKCAFRARHSDESHRARLRVEIARLRAAIRPLAALTATGRGFALRPHASEDVVVLAPPVESDHAGLLALLADGEAWSSSALALALGVSARTVQRALEDLARDGMAEAFGRGRACRWITPNVPGFPTSLLLPIAGYPGRMALPRPRVS
jgi:hypothetical protein